VSASGKELLLLDWHEWSPLKETEGLKKEENDTRCGITNLPSKAEEKEGQQESIL
jgi:hypothetical protein